MTIQSKATIKTYFETGDTPTAAQFIDLIDSYTDNSTALTYISSAAATITTSGNLVVTDGAGSLVFVSADKAKLSPGGTFTIQNINAVSLSTLNALVSGKIVTSALEVSANASIAGNANIQGNANITGNANINGNITVSGNVSVSGQIGAGAVNDFHYFYSEVVSVRTYDFVKSGPYAYTVLGVRQVAQAGDCNFSLSKNGSAFYSNNASAAATSAGAAVASANFAVGDSLTIVVVSASGCTGLAVYPQIKRAL